MYALEEEKLLTERELDTLICVFHGLSNPEISRKLCITISTVKAHISNILRKMNARNRVDILMMLIGQKDIKNKEIKQQIKQHIKTLNNDILY